MDDHQYKAARKRVKKKKEFYQNFISWLVICTGLMIFNALNYRGHWWAIYPFIGWGMGVLFQAFDVFGFPGYSNDWEERELDKEITRMEMRRRKDGLPAPLEDELDLDSWREKRKEEQKEKQWRDDDFV